MSRTIYPVQLTAPAARQQITNASFTGAGELGAGDRGAFSYIPEHTGNPNDSNDFVFRWRQYVRLYEQSWEARKIVRIPVEDALRKPWMTEGIPEEMATEILAKLNQLRFTTMLSRSMMLERLLGGCLTFMGLDSADDDPSKQYNARTGSQLRFLNAIPVSRINRIKWDTNPLSEHYMRPRQYMINGEVIDVSRCLVWDGEPLFDPYDFALSSNRANLAGFGPSKLASIWDDIVKAVGTRQAAFQMIKTNNALIMAIKDLQNLGGSCGGKDNLNKLKEIANSLSVYRAAMVDGDSVDIKTQAASFGSVPELIITFIQILSAASDIPATRFLGQAPGGLNASGESDLENYYNVIDAMQRQRIEPALRKVYDVIGYNKYGVEWHKVRKDLEFKFPPLWNETEKEESERNGLVIDNIVKLLDLSLMGDKDAIDELNLKGVLSIELDKKDAELLGDANELMGEDKPQEQIQRLANLQRIQNVDETTKLIQEAGHNPNDFNLVQFRRGMIVELEHADVSEGDAVVTAKITLAHLEEDPDYYTKLSKMENKQPSWRPNPEEGEVEDFKLHGLQMAIENPKGSERSGTDPDGTPWSSILPAHYGYVKDTKGADGDEVDMYVGPHPDSELVFVVDQNDADTGKFDEHKCIFGALGVTQAKELYLAGFSDGKAESRLGAITPMHVTQFKQWLDTGDTKAPYAQESK